MGNWVNTLKECSISSLNLKSSQPGAQSTGALVNYPLVNSNTDKL